MPRISISQRLALLAAVVALVMTVAICLLSFLQGRAVLTEHEVVNLADECNLRMFELREEFRYISREVRDNGTGLPKPASGQVLTEFAQSPQFETALVLALGRLLRWSDAHARRSSWSWIDKDIVLEAIFLGVSSEGDSQPIRIAHRKAGSELEAEL